MNIVSQSRYSPGIYRNSEFSKKAFWHSTASIGRPVEEAIESLIELYRQCSEADWDGYGANPVSKESIYEAVEFIYLLPSGFPMPNILAEPSGEIAFEWYKNKRMIFVIGFNGKNMIFYAGIFGSNKTHGTEYFSDTIPLVILENLKRLNS